VDVQPTVSQTYGTVIGHPDRYAVPFRCLVPLEIENLLVVGRSASYTSLAAGSARVIPLGMACGEAAGVAAGYAIDKGMTVRELAYDEAGIAQVQKQLKQQGAYLKDFEIHPDFMDHWAYEGVKVLRSLGLLDGGYNNDYRLEVPMSKWRYQNALNSSLNKIAILYPKVTKPDGSAVNAHYYEVNENPTVDEIIVTAAQAAGCSEQSYTACYEWLQNNGLMDDELASYFANAEANPNAAEVIVLLANVYQQYANQATE